MCTLRRLSLVFLKGPCWKLWLEAESKMQCYLAPLMKIHSQVPMQRSNQSLGNVAKTSPTHEIHFCHRDIGPIWFQLETKEKYNSWCLNSLTFISMFVCVCLHVFSNVCKCTHLTLSLLSLQRQWATYEYGTLASLSLLPRGTLASWWIAHPKRWKATLCNLPESYWWNLLKSRIAPVSENMAKTPADVISQLLPQSEQVPPRLSGSQCNAFHVTHSCWMKHRELFEALRLRWHSCDPAANYQVSEGLLVKKSQAQSAHA